MMMRTLILCARTNLAFWTGSGVIMFGALMLFVAPISAVQVWIILAGLSFSGIALSNSLIGYRSAYRIILRKGVLNESFEKRWASQSGCFAAGYRAALARWRSDHPETKVRA